MSYGPAYGPAANLNFKFKIFRYILQSHYLDNLNFLIVLSSLIIFFSYPH